MARRALAVLGWIAFFVFLAFAVRYGGPFGDR